MGIAEDWEAWASQGKGFLDKLVDEVKSRLAKVDAAIEPNGATETVGSTEAPAPVETTIEATGAPVNPDTGRVADPVSTEPAPANPTGLPDVIVQAVREVIAAGDVTLSDALEQLKDRLDVPPAPAPSTGDESPKSQLAG